MDEPRAAVVGRLETYDRLVEVGVGRRTDVAGALAERGVEVTATDVADRTVPPGVAFVRDDVSDPEQSVYEGCEAVYGLNLPPELHRPARDVARDVGVPLLFTTLGADQPAIPVERATLPGGETLYRVRDSV